MNDSSGEFRSPSNLNVQRELRTTALGPCQSHCVLLSLPRRACLSWLLSKCQEQHRCPSFSPTIICYENVLYCCVILLSHLNLKINVPGRYDYFRFVTKMVKLSAQTRKYQVIGPASIQVLCWETQSTLTPLLKDADALPHSTRFWFNWQTLGITIFFLTIPRETLMCNQCSLS